MFEPSYQISSEVLCLVSEISEQIGILETLTGSVHEVPEPSFNPFSEDDLLRAHEQLVDGLSGGVGQYRDDPRVRLHMSMLFDWMTHTEEHPLIRSCIFHYELTSVHPFLEGNERLGLFWQTLLLVLWRPVLAGLPYILRCLLDVVLQEVKNKVENKVKNKSRGKVQDKAPENALSDDAEAQLSKSEQRIVKFLVVDPRITIGALSRRLQLSEAGINKVLAALRKRGIIERVGANKNGSWKVNL